jgi:protein subunit release factor A
MSNIDEILKRVILKDQVDDYIKKREKYYECNKDNKLYRNNHRLFKKIKKEYKSAKEVLSRLAPGDYRLGEIVLIIQKHGITGEHIPAIYTKNSYARYLSYVNIKKKNNKSKI